MWERLDGKVVPPVHCGSDPVEAVNMTGKLVAFGEFPPTVRAADAREYPALHWAMEAEA